MKQTENILITGGAGFIGSHVIRLFVNKFPNYQIFNLDSLTYAGNLESLKDIEDYKKCGKKGKNQVLYDPPLPVSVVKEEEKQEGIYGTLPKTGKSKEAHSAQYDPPLPTTMLEIKSTRGKHSTEKPVQLMEWIFKYYSKEGDVILDPTMGSGSTGVACKNMNRNFIGIEKDPEIYEVAVNRLEV